MKDKKEMEAYKIQIWRRREIFSTIQTIRGEEL